MPLEQVASDAMAVQMVRRGQHSRSPTSRRLAP
jgi:hypothetical protein